LLATASGISHSVDSFIFPVNLLYMAAMTLGTNDFRVRFWGVRGSYPTTGPGTSEIGGDTSCVEISVGGRRLIFDAGTGIIPLGKDICRRGASRPMSYVFLSHTHIDHLMGLYFFEPLLTAGARSFIYGPGRSNGALQQTLRQLTQSNLFPVTFDELKGTIEVHSLSGGETLQFGVPGKRPVIRKSSSSSSQANGQLSIVTHRSPAHPREGVMLYRIEYRGKTLVYATDVEQRAGGYADIIDFAQGADMLIHDAQYLHAEYHSKTKSKKGWGHSTIEMAAEVATKAQVKKLVLFHHEPQHDDPAMRRIARLSKELFPESIVAYQGLELKLL
jgi:ribonuclease BN (tRNA processing enzyme)